MILRLLWHRWRGTDSPNSSLLRLSRWRATEGEIVFQQKVQHTLSNSRRNWRPLVIALAAMIFGGFGVYLARTFVWDAFSPRIIVLGRVGGFRYHSASRSTQPSDILIDGAVYHATRDLHGPLQPGDHIRAEIGAGSHTILSWKRVK